MRCALEPEDDFVRLLYFTVESLRRTCGSCQWAWIASDRRFLLRVWGWRADFRRRSWAKEEADEARSNESSHGCFWELVALYSTLQIFSLSVAHSLFISSWCRNDSGNFRKWRCVDWRGDWWAVKGASHSCYQEPGTVGWGTQHDVPEAVHSRGRSRELLDKAFVDRNICAQRRNLVVLFHVGSKFYPFFAFWINSWPILLPLSFVPLVTR